MAVILALGASCPWAQDGERGALLYLQLPHGLASCVSCHGPDPTQNRNRVLFAADRPEALLRALNTVSVMGYLRSELSDADVADLSAYLGRVQVVSSDAAPLALWPSTVEFGTLPPGSSSAVFRVQLANRSMFDQAFLAMPPSGKPPLTLSHDCPASLAPGAACELQMQLRLVGTAGVGGGVAWALSGFGAPLLTAWSASPGGAAALSVEPEGVVDFGDTPAGRRLDREVVLRSTGGMPVTVGLATLTGPDRARFALGSGCAAGTVLPPGSACSVTVSFQPSVIGTSRAGLQWRSDGRNPGNLMLVGRAGAAAAVPSASAPTLPDAPGGSPLTGASLTPSPSPSPAPTVPIDSGSGGGCSVASPTAGYAPLAPRPDPLWPMMVVGAAWAIFRRKSPGSGVARK
jgi:cytochrome c553